MPTARREPRSAVSATRVTLGREAPEADLDEERLRREGGRPVGRRAGARDPQLAPVDRVDTRAYDVRHADQHRLEVLHLEGPRDAGDPGDEEEEPQHVVHDGRDSTAVRDARRPALPVGEDVLGDDVITLAP